MQKIIASALLLATFLLPVSAAYKSVSVFPPFPAIAGAVYNEDSGISLSVSIPRGSDRVFWDIPLPKALPQDATAITIESALSIDGLLTGMTAHLRCGETWYTASVPLPASTRKRVSVPLSRFRSDDGKPCDYAQADLLRLQLWSIFPPVSGGLRLLGVQARTDVVGLVETGDSFALNRCRTLFDVAGIPYADVAGDFSGAENFELLVIPSMTDDMSKRSVRILKKASASGTKFISFYTTATQFAALTGIQPGKWHHVAPQDSWSSILPDAKHLGGFSDIVPQETDNLLPPYEGNGAEAVAWFADGNWLKTPLPACVVSANGALFAHVPPLPTSPAAELMRRICLKFVPELADVFAVNALMENDDLLAKVDPHSRPLLDSICEAVDKRTRLAEIPLMCSRLRDAEAASLQNSVSGSSDEFRGVWDIRASSRSLASSAKLFEKLDTYGINAVLALSQIGGTPCFSEESSGAQVSFGRFCAEAATNSIDVQAWIYAFNVEGLAKKQLDNLAAEGRLIIGSDNKPLPWLCPLHDKNRKLIVEGAVNLVKAGATGIHLDYIRYPTADGCLGNESRESFENEIGKKVKNWPEDVVGLGVLATEYHAFRTRELTKFVREIAEAVRAERPGVKVSAAVYPEVASAAGLCQDWPTWVAEGMVDFVCPMTYQQDPAAFASQLNRVLSACGGKASAMVAGLGTTADVPGPDAYGAAGQIVEVRRRKGGGFVFFHLDERLVECILPRIGFQKNAD